MSRSTFGFSEPTSSVPELTTLTTSYERTQRIRFWLEVAMVIILMALVYINIR